MKLGWLVLILAFSAVFSASTQAQCRPATTQEKAQLVEARHRLEVSTDHRGWTRVAAGVGVKPACTSSYGWCLQAADQVCEIGMTQARRLSAFSMSGPESNILSFRWEVELGSSEYAHTGAGAQIWEISDSQHTPKLVMSTVTRWTTSLGSGSSARQLCTFSREASMEEHGLVLAAPRHSSGADCEMFFKNIHQVYNGEPLSSEPIQVRWSDLSDS